MYLRGTYLSTMVDNGLDTVSRAGGRILLLYIVVACYSNIVSNTDPSIAIIILLILIIYLFTYISIYIPNKSKLL
ncbi:hypothetical protein F4813DRAFT_364009, partial [Daldinia decipiens]|uniref:uncharacterized protein n=1 Tax=Daldinia decipiens TaxID=326647 RepID=UPI0020C28BB9